MVDHARWRDGATIIKNSSAEGSADQGEQTEKDAEGDRQESQPDPAGDAVAAVRVEERDAAEEGRAEAEQEEADLAHDSCLTYGDPKGRRPRWCVSVTRERSVGGSQGRAMRRGVIDPASVQFIGPLTSGAVTQIIAVIAPTIGVIHGSERQ